MGITATIPCESCTEPATYRRACGHFYCEACPDLCDPITQRFDKETKTWVECLEDEDEVYNVEIIVRGAVSEDVEAVSQAIDEMMHDKFQAFRAETCVEQE